jgi:hypothetical protein
MLLCKRCDNYEIIENDDKTPHTTSSEETETKLFAQWLQE